MKTPAELIALARRAISFAPESADAYMARESLYLASVRAKADRVIAADGIAATLDAQDVEMHGSFFGPGYTIETLECDVWSFEHPAQPLGLAPLEDLAGEGCDGRCG